MQEIQNFKNNYKLVELASFLIIFLPIALITGPFIPDLIVCLSSIILIILYLQGAKFNFSNKIILLILILWLYSILCSLLSENIILSLESSLFYGRFLMFSILFGFILSIKPNLIIYFGYAFWITIIVVVFDGYWQFFFQENIFGIKNEFAQRLNLFATDEQILGSFLARLFPLCFIFLNLENKNITKYLLNIIFILILVLVYLSGERTAFVLITISTLMIIFLIPRLRAMRLISLILTFFAIIIINNSFPSVKDRMINSTIQQLGILTKSENSSFTYFSKEHERYYSASFKLFIESPVFGIGPKMYREKCKSLDNNPCSTHPHHYYIQLLLETGILGFLILSCFFIYIFSTLTKYLYDRMFKNTKKIMDEKLVLVLICTFINLLPIIPHGNFYNNWLSIVIYLPLGIYLYLDIKKNKTKDIQNND